MIKPHEAGRAVGLNWLVQSTGGTSSRHPFLGRKVLINACAGMVHCYGGGSTRQMVQHSTRCTLMRGGSTRRFSMRSSNCLQKVDRCCRNTTCRHFTSRVYTCFAPLCIQAQRCANGRGNGRGRAVECSWKHQLVGCALKMQPCNFKDCHFCTGFQAGIGCRCCVPRQKGQRNAIQFNMGSDLGCCSLSPLPKPLLRPCTKQGIAQISNRQRVLSAR